MDELDSLNSVLVDIVKALGGSKKVAPLMWPEKSVNAAAILLCDCLNNDRAQKLTPDQAMFILRLARNNNINIGIEYICQALGYSKPTPIQPEDEKAQLMREFITAQKLMANIAKQMESVGLLKAAA